MNSIDVRIPAIKNELNSQIQMNEKKLAHTNTNKEIAAMILSGFAFGGSIMAGVASLIVGVIVIGPAALLFPLAFTITGVAAGIIMGIAVHREDKKKALSKQTKNQINELNACLSHIQLPAFQKMIEEVNFNDPKDIKRLLDLDKCFVNRCALNASQKELNEKQKKLDETIEVLVLGIRQSNPIVEAA